MSINSADRFGTVEEFWQVLNTHTAGQHAQIPRVTSADAPRPLPDAPRSRKRGVLISIYLLLLLTVTIGIGFLSDAWGMSLLFLSVGTFPLAFLWYAQRR
jgi:hypothetical protein